jgi:hypothetical protein
LNLDSAVSIPAVFVNAPSSNTEMPTLIGGSKGTPGKFYDQEAALTLLSTLRASGLTAHVIVDDSATVEEREHFRHFSARLQVGDIVSEDIVVLSIFTSKPFYSSLLLWLASISSSSAPPAMVFCLKG